MIKENLTYILYNFPTPNILLFFAGGYALFRTLPNKSFRNILLAITVLFFVFAFRYTVPDRYAFFIPFYVTASILIGLGTDLLLRRVNHKALAYLVLFFSLIPVGVYAAAPALARRMQLNLGTREDVAYRNDVTYFLRPWKIGYMGAERFADEALDLVEDNAVIYADATTIGPLLLAQSVKGKRTDVTIFSGAVNSKNAPAFNEQTIDQLLKNKPVYVVSQKPGYCPEFILKNYDLVQTGIIWKVITR